ncbi:hypothetical protein OAS86_02790 [Gammaproteobacteria bacterium]|nr:hypothetical protein [Gammaproteobacteria bacterium]
MRLLTYRNVIILAACGAVFWLLAMFSKGGGDIALGSNFPFICWAVGTFLVFSAILLLLIKAAIDMVKKGYWQKR